MSTIHPDKQLKLNIPNLLAEASASSSKPASPASSPPRTPPIKDEGRPASLTQPGLPPKATPDSGPASHRALTQPHLPKLSALKISTQPARAQSLGLLGKKEGPNPSATFHDLLGALPSRDVDPSHRRTAQALAIVIEEGKEGLKTAFGHDDKGHTIYGSHGEVEQGKATSTQHSQLLQTIGRTMKLDASLDADARKFGGKLFSATMSRGAAVPEGMTLGGTRLKRHEEGTLQFTVSDSFGFKDVTPEVLEPIAQFHANVLRLADLGHESIIGDGEHTDGLARRVSELLGR